MRTAKILFHFIFILVGFLACNEDEPTDHELGKDYYPLSMGNYWIYQMDSITYDPVLTIEIDTTHSFFKEEIVDTFSDQLGKLSYRMDVSYRKNENQNWEVIDSYILQSDKKQLIKVENGFKFIKLIFPVSRNSSWDGNAYINDKASIVIKGEEIQAYKNWSYYYYKVHQKETINNVNYNEVTTVIEADDDNTIEYRYSLAKYARNVGLVYKVQKILDSQVTDISIPWEKRAQQGYILTQQLIAYH